MSSDIFDTGRADADADLGDEFGDAEFGDPDYDGTSPDYDPDDPFSAADPLADDDGDSDVEGEFVTGELVTVDDTSSEVAEMSPEEAREITSTIRVAVDATYQLLRRAHDGRAWAALGYSSWAEYVQAEFNMSRSRSYQLLNQAQVVEQITAAAPDGTELPALTEAATRDLKRYLTELTGEISTQTEGLDPEDAADVVRGLVDDFRGRRDNPGGYDDMDDLERQERQTDLDERAGFSSSGGGGGGGAGGYGGDGGYGDGNQNSHFDGHVPDLGDDIDLPLSDTEAPVFYEDDNDTDTSAQRRTWLAAYDLFHAITALANMPTDPVTIAGLITEDKRETVTDMLPNAMKYLTEFTDEWNKQPGVDLVPDYEDSLDPLDDDDEDEYDDDGDDYDGDGE